MVLDQVGSQRQVFTQHATLKALLSEAITHQHADGQKFDPAVDIIRLLVAIDEDRAEYYRQLEQMLKMIVIDWD